MSSYGYWQLRVKLDQTSDILGTILNKFKRSCVATLTYTLQASQNGTKTKTAKGKIIISNFIKYVKNIQ